MQREATLLRSAAIRRDAEVAKRKELDLFAKVDCSVVVTEAEKAAVEALVPIDNILVHPYLIEVSRSDITFEQRLNICFVGGFNHGPNVDAVLYFVSDIWGQVKSQLPPTAKFFIVGPNPPTAICALASEDIVVTGHVPKLDDILDQCRVSVAPIRYGAGIKGKLISSLARGLPAVASPLSVEGMGLTHGENVLVADDPGAFAAAMVRLYREKSLWERIQSAGYAFVQENYSRERGIETWRCILRAADETWRVRNRADER